MPEPFSLEMLELSLRRQLRGKTLLGEVAFSETDRETAALEMRRIFGQLGLSGGLEKILAKCPVTFASWLVNEAYYCYDGGYWPIVLPKLGLTAQPQSARLGATFLHVLDRLGLPRFRRLNTHWSYLGPILAHCGVPRTRLPQFFERVLPEAALLGVASDEGLIELKNRLPEMRVSRSIEWFIRFGEHVSADFVRRCVDMYRVTQTGDVPSAEACGLPERVWAEFRSWWQSSKSRPEPSGPRFQRPRLYLDPSRGVRLELPSQPCPVSHAFLEWDIRVDSGPQVLRKVPRYAGDSRTQSEEFLLAAPFGSVLVRLREPSGVEHGPWALLGLPTDRPVLWFDPDDLTVLAPDQVRAEPAGLVMPAGHGLSTLSGDQRLQPPVVSELGRLPFGWGTFVADVYDLSGCTAVEFADETGRPLGRLELGEREASPTQLIGKTTPELAAPDRSRVFVGEAPTLRIPTTRDAFREQWKITVEPVSEHCDAVPRRVTPPAADLFVESSEEPGYLDVPLDQPNLLGADPWGSFDVTASGPLGQGARFRISVAPVVQLEHDWSEWHRHRPVKAVLRTSAEVQATDARALGPRTFVLPVRVERTPIRLRCVGYGGNWWSIPLELHLPLPSWAVHDADSANTLTSWSTQPAMLTLSETDGRSPLLALRTSTPWGVPKSATAHLCQNDTVLFSAPVPLDARGLATVDLQPFLANARYAGYPRMLLRLDLELARTVSLECLWLDRHWKVEALAVTSVADQLLVTWSERFPAQGRVLRAYPRLAPWEPARSVKIDPHAQGRWEGHSDILAAEVGRYRLELGIEDEWTGAYECAARCDWDDGCA